MKRFFKEIETSLFGSRKRCWFTAAIVAMLLTLGDYFLSNYPYPILDDVDSIALLEYYAGKWRHNDAEGDSTVYMNIGYDKELATVVDDFGDTIGSATVTDRNTLLRMLKILENSDYKYIILDVRFDRETQTPNDTLLWRQISRMNRICYSRHSEGEDAAKDICGEKSAKSDYGVTLSTGFTRWQFIQNHEASLPVKVYSDLSGRMIKKKGWFYFDNGRLCINTLFIPLTAELGEATKESGEVRYPYVGSDLLRLDSDEEIQMMVKDKVVVIGDFEEDMHDTYVGSIAGPVLMAHTLNQLMHRRHICSVWEIVFLFLIFILIGYYTSKGDSIWDKIKWIRDRKFMMIICNFIGWELLLNVLSVAFYLMWGEYFITFLPSLIFTFIQNRKQIYI